MWTISVNKSCKQFFWKIFVKDFFEQNKNTWVKTTFHQKLWLKIVHKSSEQKFSIRVVNKRGRGYKGLWSLFYCHFFKKCSNFLIFCYCGRNVCFFKILQFQDPTQSPSCQNPCSWFSFKRTQIHMKMNSRGEGYQKSQYRYVFFWPNYLICIWYSWFSKCKISRNCRLTPW